MDDSETELQFHLKEKQLLEAKCDMAVGMLSSTQRSQLMKASSLFEQSFIEDLRNNISMINL